MAINFVRYVWELSPAWARRQYGSSLMGVLTAIAPSEQAEAFWRIVRARWLDANEITDDQVELEAKFRGLQSLPYEGGDSATPGVVSSTETRAARVRDAFAIWEGGTGGTMQALVDALSRAVGTAISSIDIVAPQSSSATYVQKVPLIKPDKGYLIVAYVTEDFFFEFRNSFMNDFLPMVMGGGLNATLTDSVAKVVERFGPAESRCRGVYLIPENRFPVQSAWFSTFEVDRLYQDPDSNDLYGPYPLSAAGPDGVLELGRGVPPFDDYYEGTKLWLVLNGTSDEVSTNPVGAFIAEPCSLFFHVKNLTVSGTTPLFNTVDQAATGADSFHFYITAAGLYEVRLRNSVVGFDETITMGACGITGPNQHTLIFSLSDGSINIYEDGVLATSGIYTPDMKNDAARFDSATDLTAASGGVGEEAYGLDSLSLFYDPVAVEFTRVDFRRFAYGVKPITAAIAREVHRKSVIHEHEPSHSVALNVDAERVARDWNAYWRYSKTQRTAVNSEVFATDKGIEFGAPLWLEATAISSPTVDVPAGYDGVMYFLMGSDSAPTGYIEILGADLDNVGSSFEASPYKISSPPFRAGVWNVYQTVDDSVDTTVTLHKTNATGYLQLVLVPYKGLVLLAGVTQNNTTAPETWFEQFTARKGQIVAASSLVQDNTAEVRPNRPNMTELYNGKDEALNLPTSLVRLQAYGRDLFEFKNVKHSTAPSDSQQIGLFLTDFFEYARFECDFDTNRYVFYEYAREIEVDVPHTGYLAQEPTTAEALRGAASSATLYSLFNGLPSETGVDIEKDVTLEWYGYLDPAMGAAGWYNLVSFQDGAGDHLITLEVQYSAGSFLMRTRRTNSLDGTISHTADTDIEVAGYYHIVVSCFKNRASAFIDGELTAPTYLIGAYADVSWSGGVTFAVGDDAVTEELRTIMVRVWGVAIPKSLIGSLYQRLVNGTVDRGFGALIPLNSGLDEPETGTAFGEGFSEEEFS